MSAIETTPAPAETSQRASVLRWIAGGGAVATALTIVAVAVWPASATEQARQDGERLGEAVSQLYGAETYAEVDDALTEVRDAARDARIHAGDNVSEQVSEQGDALARAANGFVGSVTSTEEFDAELYQAELDIAVDDLASQAEDFRAEGPEVVDAFWGGVEDGLNS
jgi:hypothetical protein